MGKVFTTLFGNKKDSPIGMFLLGILIFIAPLYSALFFEETVVKYGIAPLSLLLVFIFISPKFKLNNMLTVSLISLVILYWVTTLFAVNKGGSIVVAIRYSVYLAVYFLTVICCRHEKGRVTLITTIWASAVLVALLGLTTYSGIYSVVGGIDTDGRITSTIQYSNSLAAFLSFGLLLGLGLSQRTNKLLWQILISCGNLFMFVTLIGTQSRGGWLVSAFILFLYGVICFRERVFNGLASLIIVIVSSLLTIKQFGVPAPNKVLLLWLLIAVIVNILGLVGLNYIKGIKKLTGVLPKVVAGTVIIAFVAVLGGALLNGGSSSPILARAKAISLKERNVQERAYFYKDALKMINDNPLLGYGGDGWKSQSKKYQSYYYLTSEVHNHFLQVAVETGLIGLTIFLIAWVGFVKNCLRARHLSEEKKDKMFWNTIAIAGLGLGMHSMIDFNLSLSALAIMLWTLFGISTSASHNDSYQTVRTEKYKYTKLALAVIPMILLFFCIRVLMGFGYAEKGVLAMAGGNFSSAEGSLTKALSYDPFRAEYNADLARIWLNRGVKENSKETLKKALPYATKAVKLDQGNPDYRILRAKLLLGLEQIKEASFEAEQAITLNPWEIKKYEFSTDVNLQIGEYYLAKQEKELAKQYLVKASQSPVQIINQVRLLNSTTRELWNRSQVLEVSQDVDQKAQRAKSLLQYVN